MTFVRRRISLSISGDAGQGAGQIVGAGDLQGLRISATIVYASFSEMGTANLLIYGLTKSQLNQMSTLGSKVIFQSDFTLSIFAGDDVNGMSLVFKGKVTNAWADMQTAPGVVMHVSAQEDAVTQVKPTGETDSAVSHSGAIPASNLLSHLAALGQYKFENNNVNNMITDHYAFGSIREQVQHVLDAADAEGVMQTGTLAVWPKMGNRSGNISISKETGMVGIPGFTEGLVMVKKLFDRSIQLGSLMDIHSEVVTVANKTWKISRIEYTLESMTPHGEWFVVLYGTTLLGGGG